MRFIFFHVLAPSLPWPVASLFVLTHHHPSLSLLPSAFDYAYSSVLGLRYWTR